MATRADPPDLGALPQRVRAVLAERRHAHAELRAARRGLAEAIRAARRAGRLDVRATVARLLELGRGDLVEVALGLDDGSRAVAPQGTR